MLLGQLIHPRLDRPNVFKWLDDGPLLGTTPLPLEMIRSTGQHRL